MLKGSRLLAVLPTLGRPWTAKVLAREVLIGAAKAPTRGSTCWESLVAHRLIDRGIEWHLQRHRYEHRAWEIYLAKTMRWHSKNILYCCFDLLLDRKAALFNHLESRWQDLSGIFGIKL